MGIFNVYPLKMAMEVKLGCPKIEVHQKIGAPSRAIENKDYFHDGLPMFSVHYDDNWEVEYIEISNPKSKEIQVVLEGMSIFDMETIALVENVKKENILELDSADTEIPYSFIFPEIELSFWRHVLPENENDEEGKFFETVGIGVKGYHTSL